MIIKGSVKPKKIDIVKMKANKSRIRMTRNITKKDDLENDIYEYEESIAIINNNITNDLFKYVQNNFDTIFAYGLKQMKNKKINKQKSKRIRDMIDNNKLYDFEKNTENAVMIITKLIEKVAHLKKRIDNLEEKVND